MNMIQFITVLSLFSPCHLIHYCQHGILISRIHSQSVTSYNVVSPMKSRKTGLHISKDTTISFVHPCLCHQLYSASSCAYNIYQQRPIFIPTYAGKCAIYRQLFELDYCMFNILHRQQQSTH